MKVDHRNNVGNSSGVRQSKLKSSSVVDHFMTTKMNSSSTSMQFKSNIGLLQEYFKLSTSPQRRFEIEKQLGNKVGETLRNFLNASNKGDFIASK